MSDAHEEMLRSTPTDILIAELQRRYPVGMLVALRITGDDPRDWAVFTGGDQTQCLALLKYAEMSMTYEFVKGQEAKQRRQQQGGGE